jgi:hypothetical protein
MRDMDILRSASDYHLSAQQLAKIVTTGLSAKLLPALPPPQPGKLKKKLPRQTSVPNIRHIIAGSVRRIIATGGSGPYIDGNVVPCCTTCNWMKRNYSRDQFIAHIRAIAAHLEVKPNVHPIRKAA